MKKIFYGVLIAAAVFFGSCVNENENPAPFKAGEVVNVKFTAGLQASPKAASRAVGGIGNENTALSGLANLEAQAPSTGTPPYDLRYNILIWNVDDNVHAYDGVVVKSIDGSNPPDLRTLSFSVPLTTRKNYRTTIWADITQDAVNAGKDDWFYDTSAFPTVTLTDALSNINKEAKDAYFVTDTRVVDGNGINLVMKRPFGKIRFLARDYEALSDAPNSGLMPGKTEQDEMTTKAKYLSPVYTAFDASTGEVDLSATQVLNSDENTTNSYENNELAIFWDYVLAPSAEQILAGAVDPQIRFEIEYDATSSGSPVGGTRQYTDSRIIVERNKLTTVRDNLFDFSMIDINVTILDPFEGETLPLAATVRYIDGTTAPNVTIQRDASGEGSFACPRGVAAITLFNTTTEILIGSAPNQKVTLKFNADTLVVPRYDGTTVLINTVAELLAVKNNLAGEYRMDGNINLQVKKPSALGAPADSLEWVPIGTNANRFTGTFDGNGHTVSSLKVSAGGNYTGFFGYAGTGSVTAPGNRNGGLVGYIDNTTSVATACYSTATVGGSGGSLWGSGGTATIVSNCFTNGTAQTGVTKFGDGTGSTGWPTGSGAWSLCLPNFSDVATNYWRDLGDWNSGTNPVYPKLWWEK